MTNHGAPLTALPLRPRSLVRYALRTSMPVPRTRDSGPVVDLTCGVCGRRIPPGAAAAGTPDRILHLSCYLTERDELRSAEPSEAG